MKIEGTSIIHVNPPALNPGLRGLTCLKSGNNFIYFGYKVASWVGHNQLFWPKIYIKEIIAFSE